MASAVANVNVDRFSEAYLAKAAQVFLRPSPQMRWDEIVPRAVAQNTFRGFHRVNKTLSGAKEAFVGFFKDRRFELMDDLASIETRDDLHQLCNRICNHVRDRLGNCVPRQLQSYNKVRKPIDLYIEHLVAMATELQDLRPKLTPLLFLPLDSQILADPALFSERELSSHRLSRTSTYKDILDERTYCDLQGLLSEKALLISKVRQQPFDVIYFDLIWNDRFRKEGGNLFKTNVGLTMRCS